MAENRVYVLMATIEDPYEITKTRLEAVYSTLAAAERQRTELKKDPYSIELWIEECIIHDE